MLRDENSTSSDLGRDLENAIPAAITDTGCERDLNEDRYAVIESESGISWIVCDGMGGSSGGELAAQLAIDGMRRDLENLPGRTAVAALKSAILEANRIIVLRRQNQAFAQMGTTIVAAHFNGVEIALGHVGDSRAYLVRGMSIRQLTSDHTFVQDLVDQGKLSAEEALSHEQAHILTRAIGSEPGLNVDMQRFWLWDPEPGDQSDILVMCTDGLYTHVSDEEILKVISTESPQKACLKLVEMSKERGGFDNITVAVVPIDGRLMDSPPEGYEEESMYIPNSTILPEEVDQGSWAKSVVTMLILSVLSVLLVLTSMALYLGS